MKNYQLLDRIRGQLIVSCQAVPGEPLYLEEGTVMPLMARAAKRAGSPMIRTSSIRDVIAIKVETGLPVIGLIKIQYEGFDRYITPTMREVEQLVDAGADIIALDCTNQKRGDGSTIESYMQDVREKYPDQLLMADISTYEEGVRAWQMGMDLVGTTMSGYTPQSLRLEGPDYQLVRRLAETVTIPVIGEGRVHAPEEAVRVLQAGAWAVVVGGAITPSALYALSMLHKKSMNKIHEGGFEHGKRVSGNHVSGDHRA